MRIPDVIQVGPYTYTVKRNHVFKDNRNIWGIKDGTLLELRFFDTNQGDVAHETVSAETRVHELLHAISDAFLPEVDHLTESQVELLSRGILDTIRRNKIDLLNTEADVEVTDRQGLFRPAFEDSKKGYPGL